ncbi:MAG: T9SS type A sorting domain-containing protein, partial [Bacteroidales bacterium]|nr:T9SS type A sorting domain-containing protein [Bacteroidales bacterium]
AKNNEIIRFEIYDVSGKLLKSLENNSFIGLNKIEIPLNHIFSGIYILKTGNNTAKFVKN